MAVVLVRDVPEKGFSSTEVSVSERVVEDYLKRGWKLKDTKKSSNEVKQNEEETKSKEKVDNFFSENKEVTEKAVNSEKIVKTKKN